MSYTRKQRAEAAARGWNKRREKHLQQPEYTKVNLPKESNSAGLIDIGAELPIGINALAGGIAKWEDPILDLDASAYVTMRRCGAIKKATRKLAIRTVKLNWTVVGAKKPKPAPKMPTPDPLAGLMPVTMPAKLNKLPMAGDVDADLDSAEAGAESSKQTRAEAVAEIFGQIQGWSDFVDWCTGSIHEGTRFYQIKTSTGREKAGGEAWKVPNLTKGGRHRVNAGGDLEWDGAEKLVQQQTVSGQADRKPKELPLDQFCIHSPGGSSNPNGDLDLGVALFNAVVKPWNRGIMSGDLWVRLFAVPAILAGTKVDKARPDRIATMLDARAQALAASLGTQGNTTALTNDELIRLLQADPAGLTGMVAWQQYLEGIADDMITLGALTGSAGVSQANRTGDTETHRDNEDEAAFANAVQIAETFNRHILPWIIKKNPNLPPLEEGESEVYLWPNDPNEGDEQDVDVETEGVEDAPELDEGDEGKPANMALIALRQIVQLGKKKDGTVRLARGDAALTPPVHNHCRCWISPDGVWYDAQDARVCTQCMVLGASYNAMSDIPQDPKEVDRLLDQKTFEEVKKAIERDSGLANRIIEQSATNLQSGVLKVAVEAIQPELVARAANMARLRAQIERLRELRKVAVGAEAAAIEAEIAEVAKAISAEAQAAPSLTVAVEREIVKARAAARAAAPIQAGRIAPGIGAAPDAIVFETTPVGKVARLVSVNVATGAGHRVIWRGGKYLLQTTGGRTIDSNADLWWLLLLLALLEKERRDREAKRGTVNLGGDGRWVTINGTPVFIEDGVITKGPAGMKGKTPGEAGGSPEKPARIKPKNTGDARKGESIPADSDSSPRERIAHKARSRSNAAVTPAERDTLTRFTGEEKTYSSVREYMLGNTSDKTAAMYANDMAGVVSKVPVYEGEVFRGMRVNSELAGRITSADTLELRTFASSSTRAEIAGDFARGGFGSIGDGKTPVVMSVETRTGANIGGLSEHKYESEVILRPGTKYRVTGREQFTTKRGEKAWHIKLREIATQDVRGTIVKLALAVEPQLDQDLPPMAFVDDGEEWTVA